MPTIVEKHKAHRWAMAFRPSTPFGMTGQGKPNDGFSIPDREFFQKAMPAKASLGLGDDLILNNDFNLPQKIAFVKPRFS